MPNVIFVVPFALDTTLRFVRGAAGLGGVNLGIVSQEPADKLPRDVQRKVTAHEQIPDALDVDSLTDAVRRIAHTWGGRVDGLIGILEQAQESLAAVRERLGIRGMDPKTARNFRDKSVMKDLLRANGLPCAGHRLANTADEALGFAERTGYPLVVKPPAGAGAKNTFRVGNREQLAGYLRTMPPSAAKPLLLEEFVTGREFSFDSVSLGGRHLFHSISEYYPTPLEVMESPWIQWCVLLPRDIEAPRFDAIREVGPAALSCLGMVTGMTHMEWFRRSDESIAVSEVAARPPGAQFTTLLSYAHDIDFYKAWAKLVIFEEFEVPERAYSSGAVFLRGQGEGQVVDVKGLEELNRELGDLVVEARLPKKGQPKASSYEGEGFVILRHPETEAVEDGLRKLLHTLRVELG